MVKKEMDYVLLTTIYAAPERDAFAPPYSAAMLKEQVRRKALDKKVIPIGNIEIETIEQLKDLGVQGAVINHAIWDRFNIHTTQDFKELINYHVFSPFICL
jgi:thiamine-phosphate pyrophosphorylase